MLKAASSECVTQPLRLLLAGGNEEEFVRLGGMLAKSPAGSNGAGFHLKHADSPAEALGHDHETRYDVLLCSDQSTDDAALQLLRQVREDHAGVPVVFLSSRAGPLAVRAAIQACSENGREKEISLARSASFDDSGKRQREQSEETLQTLWRTVEQSADLVIILDSSGVMEYVNPAFEAITGYSQKEAIGQTLGLLKSEQSTGKLYEEMRNALLAGHVFRGIVEERKKNGETCTVENALTPVRDATGRVAHFICTGHDITDQRRMQSELQQSQKMDAIGRLAGGVAHDFNNLLLVISAYADLALDAIPEGDPVRRNLSEIITASRRAADLTRQLLAFGHKQAHVVQVLDLNALLADIAEMLSRLIGEDIELIITPGQNLGRIRADRVQIEQIVMNLAANARDAMPGGGKLNIVTSTLRVDGSHVNRDSVVPPGDYVVLTVTDSGEGIAPQHLAHIFEPFYTTKDADKGTGLGLATVHSIVKQIGGVVCVCTELGLGATFKIYLPQIQSLDCEMRSLSIEEGCPGGCETVLLVEDETAVRESTAEFLVKCGYTVLPAGNGERALRASREHSGLIHLMVCDVVLPGMSGPQLAERLGMERPEMKAFFVSGYAEKTVLQHGQIDLTESFLQKPFSLRTLARKVREVLEGSAVSAMAASSSA